MASRDSQKTREIICQAAIRLAGRDGLMAMTLDNVAKEAGVSKGGLMHHFHSKDELVLAMFETFSRQMENSLRNHMSLDKNPKMRWARAMIQCIFPNESTLVDNEQAISREIIHRFMLTALTSAVSTPAMLGPIRELGVKVRKEIQQQPNGLEQLMIWLAMDGLFLWQFIGFINEGDELYQTLAEEFRRRVLVEKKVVSKQVKIKARTTSKTTPVKKGIATRRKGVVSKKLVLFWSVVVVIVALATGRMIKYQHDRIAEVDPKTLTQVDSNAPRRIHALGRLEPLGTVLEIVPRSSNERAIVAQLLVREGDVVEQGTLLALMDTHDRRKSALDEAKARLEVAKRRLDQIKAGAKAGDIQAAREAVEQASESERVAKLQLDRVIELAKTKQVSDEERVDRQWIYDRAKTEVERATALLEAVQEIRPTDIALGEAQVDEAAAAVAFAKSELDASTVSAPISGKVLKIHTYPGESVGNQGLMQIGDVAHMMAVAEVYEADVLRIKLGANAEVVVDSSGEKFHGVVREIGLIVGRKVMLSIDPVSDTDARVLEVRIALNAADSDRLQRLSNARVEVSIDGSSL